MSSDEVPAFAGKNRVGKISIVKFNVSNNYEIPMSLINCDIYQFQTALNFSAKLIDLQKSLSDDFVKSSVYEDYIKSIECKIMQKD